MSWKLDTSHSEVTFSVRHMMISKVRGQFEKLEVDIDLDLEQPENTHVEARIAADSINTRDENRDGHLKSPDFLDAGQYPYLVFRSTKVDLIDENHARMIGDLTIRDVTRPVEMEVEFNGRARSPWGAISVGFSASTSISRREWELNWNVALETGGWLVSDQIEISLQLELVEQPQPELVTA